MKKSIVLFLASLQVLVLFAKQLPSGIEAPVNKFEEKDGKIVYAMLAAETEIPTKYGTFTSRANSGIRFYENGQIEYFYATDNKVIETDAGTFTISSFNSASKPVPLTFYEDGTLKRAYLPVVNTSKAPKNNDIVKTPFGNVEAKQASEINFYENGAVMSFTVRADSVLAEGCTAAKDTLLSFHKSGNLKEISTVETIKVGSIKSKSRKPLEFSDAGKILSLTPSDDSYLELNDIAFFFYSGFPVTFWESGKYKSFVIDVANKDAAVAGSKIFCSTEQNVMNPYDPSSFSRRQAASKNPVNYTFYENGLLESIKGAKEETDWTGDMSFVFQFGTIFIRTHEVLFYENGGLKSVTLTPLAAMKGSAANVTDNVGKLCFSPDQKVMAKICFEVTKSDSGSFYDRSEPAIIFNDATKKIIDGRISMNSSITWNEENKPVKYTCMDKSSEPGRIVWTEEEIK